jgi:hypothetical protein
MGYKPQRSCRGGRIEAELTPPPAFVAVTMQLAMMAAAQRHREFVADLAAKRAILRKAQVMGQVCWATNRT